MCNMNVPDDLMSVVQQQFQNNPDELKKLKKKMKKWGKQPGAQQKIENMMRTMGLAVPKQEEKEKEPREVLRAKLKQMKDKRTGKK